MAKLRLLVWLLLVTAITSGYAAAVVPGRNTITHIKGFDGPLPFSLETGYVQVEETHGVELFYYFIQSERNPQEDPLILWISGGPGCSGLNALFFDIGPLKLDVAGYTEGLFPRLVYFEDSWTKATQVLKIWRGSSKMAQHFLSCHSGCMLTRTSVHVSKTDVFSIPAK